MLGRCVACRASSCSRCAYRERAHTRTVPSSRCWRSSIATASSPACRRSSSTPSSARAAWSTPSTCGSTTAPTRCRASTRTRRIRRCRARRRRAPRAARRPICSPASPISSAAVDGWMASLYHRRPILTPTLEQDRRRLRALCPTAALMAALMFVDGKSNRPTKWPVAYPDRQAADIPLEFTKARSRTRSRAAAVGGYPITLQFPPFDQVNGVTATLVDGGGKAVPFHLSTPEHPATVFGQYGVVCMIPKLPLRPQTEYDGDGEGDVEGQAALADAGASRRCRAARGRRARRGRRSPRRLGSPSLVRGTRAPRRHDEHRRPCSSRSASAPASATRWSRC